MFGSNNKVDKILGSKGKQNVGSMLNESMSYDKKPVSSQVNVGTGFNFGKAVNFPNSGKKLDVEFKKVLDEFPEVKQAKGKINLKLDNGKTKTLNIKYR